MDVKKYERNIVVNSCCSISWSEESQHAIDNKTHSNIKIICLVRMGACFHCKSFMAIFTQSSQRFEIQSLTHVEPVYFLAVPKFPNFYQKYLELYLNPTYLPLTSISCNNSKAEQVFNSTYSRASIRIIGMVSIFHCP